MTEAILSLSKVILEIRAFPAAWKGTAVGSVMVLSSAFYQPQARPHAR